MTPAEFAQLTKEGLQKILNEKFPGNKEIVVKVGGASITGRNWHTEILLERFKFINNPSGCGSMIFYNYYSYFGSSDVNIALIKYLMDMLNKYSQCGVFITTSGCKLDQQNKHLHNLGFKEVVRYDNIRHTWSKDTQALLICDYTNKTEENEKQVE
jgi:hypothetical protein